MPRKSDSGWSARSIAASFERSIHSGRVSASEALPPVRELAARLKVSPATVAAAYRLLRARGLTAAHGRRGTRIVPRPPVGIRAGRTDARPDHLVDLASGNPDPALLPSFASALRALDPAPALYDRAPHLAALLAFAAGELETDGVAPAALTVVSGALDGIERVLREHLRPGDAVAVEDPSFPALVDLLAASGYAAVPFEVDASGPVPASFDAALRRSCRAAIVTARAQNPTGAAITDARASELRSLLRRHPDVLLVENDPCASIAGAPLATLIDPARHRWAHVRSTAKSLGPDLRLAIVAGDALTVSRVEGRFAIGPRRVSLLLQQLVLSLWSDPAAGRHLARAADTYARRRDALGSALAERGITAAAASGLNVWVPVAHERAVVDALAARGWAVAEGEPFRLTPGAAIRVTTASLDPADAARLAADIADAAAIRRRPSA